MKTAQTREKRRAVADDEALIAQYIEPHPLYPGLGEYRLKEEYNGYPVWSLIGTLMPDGSNVAEIAEDGVIPVEAVEAARAFYLLHKQAIDDRLAANRSW